MILTVETVRREKKRDKNMTTNKTKSAKPATKTAASPSPPGEEVKAADTKAEASEASSEAPKRRGPPAGPKKRYFACFAMKGDEVIADLIEGQTLSEAKKGFTEKYKLDALKVIDSPVFPYKGNANASNSVSVTLKTADIYKMTGKIFEFTYQGWKCMGNGLHACTSIDGRAFDSDQLVLVNAIEPLDKKNKGKKPRMKPAEALPLSETEDAAIYQPA